MSEQKALPPDGDEDSPWNRSHRTTGQQAATPLRGPSFGEVQVNLFTQDAGKTFGTSPFMVLSSKKYAAQPNARTVWGATLTDVYKYEIDGDSFRFGDSFKTNALPLWVGWNLFRLSGDRVVVPNPSGLRLKKYKETPCYGTSPSLLVFQDGSHPGSPIQCVKKFEFNAGVLRRHCGFSRTVVGTTAVLTGKLPSGFVAVTIVEQKSRSEANLKRTHLAVLDPDLNSIVACAYVGDGTTSNQFPVERHSSGTDLAYVATETELVKMAFYPITRRLRRVEGASTNYRNRTGTTPTLVNTSSGHKLIVTVDGKCAVTKVFTGEIKCSDALRSELVVLDRTNLTKLPLRVALPEGIDTVENSPAASGDDLVVANYSGYSPNGKKDKRKDFARGIARMHWTGNTFTPVWYRRDIQMNGVPTISTGSNTVYSSGAEADGLTYVYGLDLTTGTTRLRVAAGPSSNTSRKLKDGVFDAGNNFLINDDGSGIFSAGETIVRVR